MRSAPEWIGKTDDSRPPQGCQRRILDRQQNRCAISGIEFAGGDKVEFDHITPLWLGGRNCESNLQAVRADKHAAKTRAEATVRSKVNANRLKHLGQKRRKGPPMMGTKASGWKKPFYGPAERRPALWHVNPTEEHEESYD